MQHRGNQPWVVSDPGRKTVPGREKIAPHFPGSYQKKTLFCCKAMPSPAPGTGRHMGPGSLPAQAQSKARDTETALPLSGAAAMDRAPDHKGLPGATPATAPGVRTSGPHRSSCSGSGALVAEPSPLVQNYFSPQPGSRGHCVMF